MERLIADRIKRNNKKVKASANKSKGKLTPKQDAKPVVIENVSVMKESKTLMLEID